MSDAPPLPPRHHRRRRARGATAARHHLQDGHRALGGAEAQTKRENGSMSKAGSARTHAGRRRRDQR